MRGMKDRTGRRYPASYMVSTVTSPMASAPRRECGRSFPSSSPSSRASSSQQVIKTCPPGCGGAQIPPPGVQLGEHIVQQQHRPLAQVLLIDLPEASLRDSAAVRVCPWEAKRAWRSCRSCSTAEIVLVGAGKALAGLQLRLAVGLLMGQELGGWMLPGGLSSGSVTVDTVS